MTSSASRLRTTVGGFPLKNPVICASGEHVRTGSDIRRMIDAGASAVVAKSANESTAARRQARAIEWTFLDSSWTASDAPASTADGGSLLNRSGLVEHRWEDWMETLATEDAYARTHDAAVIASVVPGRRTALPRLIADLDEAGLRWIELNLSAPHAEEATPGAIVRATDPVEVGRLTATAREVTNAHLTVKLTPEAKDVVALAQAARSAGADSVSMIGRHLGFVPDLDTRLPVLGTFGAVGGGWALPIALRWVAKTRIALGCGVPIVGTNGVRSGLDIARFLLAGACAVQVATIVLAHGPGALTSAIDELAGYLEREEVSVAELIGIATDSVRTYGDVVARGRGGS